jgi:UDPglucose 6-dehydrogenase
VIGGYGYVGKAVHELFDNHPKFMALTRDKAMTCKNGNGSDLAIVCVPTPMKEDGTCETAIVEGVIADSDFPLYLIKSAVPPGTTDVLSEKYNKNICVSPEYIGEGNYTMPWWEGKPHPTDMSKHNFQIFGGNPEHTEKLVRIFSTVLGPYCKFFQTDSKTAELVKYMENSFFATKVTFCHEFSLIAKSLGVNYAELRELWLLDQRIDRGSTAVFDGKLGYSGKCLPKDISAIYQAAMKAGYESDFLRQVMETNMSQRKTNGYIFTDCQAHKH